MEKIDYNNLRKLTVYDICDDSAILKRATAGMSKKEALENYKEKPVNQAFGLLDFADLTNNLHLREAVLKEWEVELQHFFNE